MTKEELIAKHGLEAYQKKLESARKWYENNKEQQKERVKKCRQDHPGQHAKQNRKWNEAHRERCNEIVRKSQRNNQYMFAFVISEEKELIENYELALKDDFKGWTIHHKRGTDETDPLTADELKAQGLYYNRSASELVFLTRSEHAKLHGEYRNDK